MNDTYRREPWRATHTAFLKGNSILLSAESRFREHDGKREEIVLLYEQDQIEPSWALLNGTIRRLRENVGDLELPITPFTHGGLVRREDRHRPIG